MELLVIGRNDKRTIGRVCFILGNKKSIPQEMEVIFLQEKISLKK